MKQQENKFWQVKHLRNLYEKVEEDLVNNMCQAWLYQKEVDNPTHIGKAQAEEALATYQKRIQYLKENLDIYRKYAREELKTEL